MAGTIETDFSIDYVNQKITYDTAFSNDRPPYIYTMNELYSYLQDVFDEPEQMDDPVPMSAQTPTQYTMLYPWFIDNESVKALYGGSLQTSGWAFNGTAQTGITGLRWQDSPSTAPDSGDLGETWTGGSSGATGIVLALDTTRQVAWVRNTNGTQFTGTGGSNEAVTGSGSDPNFNTESYNGVLSGNNIWINAFSVGSLQSAAEVYIGQHDDYMGGVAFHDLDTDSRYERRTEKIAEWWDSDVDFATGSPNLLGGAGHVDLLLLSQEMGTSIDGGRFFAAARRYASIYSHFEFVATTAGNYVIPFASTAADLNNSDGCYNVGYDAGSGTPLVGDIVEDDTGGPVPGRLRLVITAVNGTTDGDIDYYLIGENDADGTLKQVVDDGPMQVRASGSGVDFDIDATTTPITFINGGLAQDITIHFEQAQRDIDEDTTDEEYACVIDCSNEPLAEVYERVMFLTCRGNQDGGSLSSVYQNKLLPSGKVLLSSLDVDTIAWQSGNTVRYTFNGTPDLSGVEVDDKYVATSSTNSSNDGCFNITAVNDGSDYIEVYNPDRGDGTDDEATDSPSVGEVLNAEAGEFYRAVGDIVISWDSRANAGISEGQLVKGSLSGATGVVVSANTTSSGKAVLTQVRGTFVENDVVSDIDDGSTNTVTLDSSIYDSIVDNAAAPFGTFAGGRWFVARGVVLDNVPTADANNWETLDINGTRVVPPSRRSITFAGLSAGVRAAIFEVDAEGSTNIVKTVGVASGTQYSSLVVLDSNVAQDAPPTGWIRVVDTSDAANGTEFRLEYSSYTGTNVTLRDLSAYDATADAGGSTTTIVDSGAFTNFGADGQPKIGMIVLNTDNTVWSHVVRKVDNNTLEVTDNGTTWASKNYEFNTVPVTLANDDTCYFGYIDDVSTGSSLSKTIKYDGDTWIIARARYSDVDLGPNDRLLPFEQLGQQITDADLTITAIATDDTIAATS